MNAPLASVKTRYISIKPNSKIEKQQINAESAHEMTATTSGITIGSLKIFSVPIETRDRQAEEPPIHFAVLCQLYFANTSSYLQRRGERGPDFLSEIRRTVAITSAMELVHGCFDSLISQGIDQWDDLYLNGVTVSRDVAAGTTFVATVDRGVVGMAVLNEAQEPEYAEVPCAIRDDQGSSTGSRWRHLRKERVLGALILYVAPRAESLGCDCIRLDVYTGNAKAVRFYERSDYRCAGQVPFREGEFQCFETRLGAPATQANCSRGAAPPLNGSVRSP